MFNLETVEEITGQSTINSTLTTLDAETCAKLLIAESVKDLTRPIRRKSANPRIAIQQKFNREISQMIEKADGTTNDTIVELMKQAALRVQTAQQSDDEEAVREAVERLERVVNFLADLASNVTRNSFYRNEECLQQETPAADGANETGVDGAVGAFETRSKYAGWKSVIVESTTMTDGADEAINGLLAAVGSLLPFASAYVRQIFTDSKSKPCVQLGYRMQSDGEAVQFYTRKDVWQDLEANRREYAEPMTAEEAAAAFKL